jgi:signal transduction histidine kinase
MGDTTQLVQLFQNLIGNAIKFTPARGHITLNAQVDAADAQQVAVSVRDDGPGISPDLQTHLFQKFVSGRVRGRGSGLGLAFCRLVVEAHGGRIWVESAPGSGAAFYFTLPVAEA